MARISETTNELYSLRVPAHCFCQGGRKVYHFALDLETLDGFLPLRVDERVIREANRRLTPSHANNIRDYLAEREQWLLGTLMLGIAGEAIEFEPYEEIQALNAGLEFGELRIRTNRINTMKLFDGQHRRRAIQDVLAILAQDGRRKDRFDDLKHSALTVMLYQEDDEKALRQMFVDASRTKRIEAHTTTRFDQYDAFSQAAVRLAEGSPLFMGRVEMERSSVAASSPNLIAINQLASILKTLIVGYARRVSRNLNQVFLQDMDALHIKCSFWADEFLPAAREEYKELTTGEVINSDLPRLRSATYAYHVTVLRILAGCYHAWGEEDWSQLAAFLRRSSLKMGYKRDSLLVAAGAVPEMGKTVVSRRQEVDAAISYIVKNARE